MTETMESSLRNSALLFDVFLRLRPPTMQAADRFLVVESSGDGKPTQITINPPHDDYRRRAIERYSFTQIFEENATQLDVFEGANVLPLIQGVLGSQEKAAKDGLLATLGVTGSGKSHTILGSKSQRGITQITLDILFRSIGDNIANSQMILSQIVASDVSDARIETASGLIESTYGEGDSRVSSRAQTPLPVSVASPAPTHPTPTWGSYKSTLGLGHETSPSCDKKENEMKTIRPVTGIARITRSVAKLRDPHIKEQTQTIIYPSLPKPNSTIKRHPPRSSALPQLPNVNHFLIDVDQSAEYAVVLSMYEVYNNRIFDLLSSIAAASKASVKDTGKSTLFFKNTEFSPDKKVVAGLRKVVCSTLEEALMVLEIGLTERAVAGTGSNAVSSRSHGFFCVEIRKRRKGTFSGWSGSTLTIADLAGSERARAANTYGSTLAEAGKINQSLMLLGQCMQAQSGISGSTDISLSKLAMRQCKLTELLFSNSFYNPPSSLTQPRQQQQKAIMIVTADPRGDFNATSQILKYSALAKETTVLRIPSVSSTIHQGHPFLIPPRPIGVTSAETSEEISRLSTALESLQSQLTQERRLRQETEASWSRAEERLETLDAEIREECWTSFEQKMQAEKDMWRAAWDEERERNEGHVDSKLEVLMRGMQLEKDDGIIGGVDGDGVTSGSEKSDKEAAKKETERLADRVEELERENEVLKAKLAGMERERGCRTPSRKIKVLKGRPWNLEDVENLSP